MSDPRQYAIDCGVTATNTGRTKQADTPACDINTIVSRYIDTGEVSHLNRSVPTYGDYSNVSDYQTACQVVTEAKASFMRLPAELRSRLGNDPQQFIDYCADPENRDELVKLGLALPVKGGESLTAVKPGETAPAPAEGGESPTDQ